MFPRDFPFLRALAEPPSGANTGPFVIGAMTTPSHRGFAERLFASCRAQGLPLALFEVPGVHRSISPNGNDDLRFTKANLVHFLLHRYDRPVLYLDADCVIAQPPVHFNGLLQAEADFAIFNWLAEEHTEAYFPVTAGIPGPDGAPLSGRRYYGFHHSIDAMSRTQLLCSGAVQWYANTVPARRLLQCWHGVIERAPRSADDKCLDFAFNNLAPQFPGLRVAWLDKSHARYAWWIYVRPVINHPELPHPGDGFAPLDEIDGRPRIHLPQLWEPGVDYVFPRDCLIDTETRTLLRLQDGAWRRVAQIESPLWL